MGTRHRLRGVWSAALVTMIAGLLPLAAQESSSLPSVPGSEPAQWIGDHPLLAARLNDVPRSLARLDDSPYADIASTAWGQRLFHRIVAQAGTPDWHALGPTICRAAFSLDDQLGAPGIRWAVMTSNAQPMRHWCDQLLAGVTQGRLSQHGTLFAFHPQGDLGRPAAPAPPAHPDACLELTLDPGRILGLAGVPPESGLGTTRSPRPWTVSLSVDRIGLREHWDIPFRHPDQWQSVHLRPAHAELLSALPADTLMACTFSADGDGLLAGLAASGIADRPLLLVVADMLLIHAGLPSLLDVLNGLQGDCVVWMEEGTPLPCITAVAGMQAPLARQVMTRLALAHGMTWTTEGGLIGFCGVCPFQVAYQDGRLILTTHPSGIAGCLDQPAGFSRHADAAAALAELPHDALLLGVARSAPASAALMRLALMPLAHAGMPELSTLPQDLARRAQHGFLSLRQVPSGLQLDAGGLIGGPAAAYATLSMGALLLGEASHGHARHLSAPPTASGQEGPPGIARPGAGTGLGRASESATAM